MPDLVALYRRPSYSPLQHRNNDTAILADTTAELARLGWRVIKATEEDVEQGRLPSGVLYLNMCQGPLASEQLMPFEGDGVVVVNGPTSVLNCHRHRLVRHMTGSEVSFPRTHVQPSTAPLPSADTVRALGGETGKIWVKRGDVHAERREDVVAASAEDLPRVLSTFAARNIAWVALQEHVPGPVVKFYGVTEGRFFRWYGADAGYGRPGPVIDESCLKAMAFEAAALLGLEVFGGDVAFLAPDRPVLIDINDWPSFAPFREEAARAIAEYVHDRVEQRRRA
ncbi:MAG TPA: hypothetical protein VLV16_10700 [Gemmatimonadales bacterium]|nr:hypothetical protein [Gemmatimonadales bacterium]